MGVCVCVFVFAVRVCACVEGGGVKQKQEDCFCAKKKLFLAMDVVSFQKLEYLSLLVPWWFLMHFSLEND